MATRPAKRVRLLGALASAACLVMTAPGSFSAGAAAPPPSPSGSWPYPNADLDNTRDAPDSAISSANVSTLQQAWTFKLKGKAASGIPGFGSLAVVPLVVDGVVYLQDLDANVYALALATGRPMWEYRVNSPLSRTDGPDGVAVVDGVVYGDSPTTAFALDAATGRRIWVDHNLLRAGQGTFGIQPQVANGPVYLASAVGTGPGGGVLMALNASTGAPVWKFNTFLGPDKNVYAAGGAWETPLAGTDGSVTYGIGNPYQMVKSAIADPSELLYNDSDVNLNAATGKLRWYYQGEPDDFRDYDLQDSPMSATVNGASVVIGAGKMGYVDEMDAETGKLIWKTPVGEHNGHDNDSVAALDHQSTLKVPFTYLPGSFGGVLTNMALAGNTVYVCTVDLPFRITSLSQIPGVNVAPTESLAQATGDVEALDLSTGAVVWDTKVPQMPLGAATVSNDLVFTTLYGGVLVALDTTTGAIVYRHPLPTSTNSPIAIAGNTVLVPAGGPSAQTKDGHPQLVAYTVASAGTS